MCGRFTLQSPNDAILDLFGIDVGEDLRPRYNVAPTQSVPALRRAMDGPELALLHWGLIPFFSKDRSWAARMINARSETAALKPSFRAAFKKRRCLIPADGFIEWKREGKKKLPFHITRRDQASFAMAGLWERWDDPEGGILESATVLTTTPNEEVAALHDRMPVIIDREDFAFWLDPKNSDVETLGHLLEAPPAETFDLRAVSTRVNNARHDDAACLEDYGD